ncbi:MAG TPA: TlpA disulfide reductase family protein [Vicinamibacterales bacterium]|nr:TlpA disulfide reductase family protein [Vicinamibacterales bacterium]
MKQVLMVAALVSVVGPGPLAAQPPSIAGLWDATVTVGGIEIPFRMELSGAGSSAKGSFFNGDDKIASTTGSFQNGSLSLSFDEYGSTLEAALKDGALDGQYARGTRGAPYAFHAKRFTPAPPPEGTVPSIAGLWNMQTKSSKGEDAWHLIVRQSGAEVSAAILRVDGDTGTLTGAYRDGRFVLGHFSGARPLRVELTPGADGTLSVVQNREAAITAYRDDQARAKGLPQPTDPSRFTSVKDPTEPFRFSFPNLDGKLVSNTDPQFRGKVVIVDISGSWCPNCHDETPFLVDLYKTYHSRGLEIVALSFEEAAQLKNPVRLRAFNKHYGIPYTVLLAGEPREASDKLPQTVNMNSFPTTFFLGRDGRVRAAHAGFPGKASGSFHEEAKKEITHTVEQLLAERAQTTSAR